MTARDQSILEKNLLHSTVDFAKVDSAGGMTMLGTGDRDLKGQGLEGGVRGGGEEELPKMCYAYANCVCEGVLCAIYRCCFCMQEVSTHNRSSTNRLLPPKPTPILDLSQDYFKE
ncbi:hypothetical protein RHGRI_017154 [Rhododendron griersonianum]|uniref:Uncharacterized protein n=1 Tax=Rhododendron griersonianum TaxID=479676 RepID=A0AAV6JWV2_9ERIC|nr:hypothetical protein RHGRI_017154 [Rhododendron griersonianum]